jgi:hypothetical protein
MPSTSKRGVVAALAVVVLVSGLIAYSAPLGTDYLAPPCHPYVCDDAGPAIAALVAGKPHDFFANQPPMGAFSLLVRAPFAALGKLAGGNDLLIYRLGAFVCVLALGLLAVTLMAIMARRRRPLASCLLVPVAIVVSPLTYSALEYGHPEELLGAALCAGAMLGCALATKQWAALAVLPVLLAAPRGTRLRLALAAGGFAAALFVPMIAADTARFWLAQKSVGIATTFQHTVTASNVWFPFAHGSTAPTLTPHGIQVTTMYSLSSSLGHFTHPFAIAVALALTAAYGVRRRRAAAEEALQLLALVFLVRCLLDPLTYSYHHAPFLVALTAYEGLRRRVPVMTGFAFAAILTMTHVIAPLKEAALVNAFYLSWAIPLALVLAACVLAPRWLSRPAVTRVLATG